MLEKIVVDLSEHFDAVQILATWMDGGATKSLKPGSGNFYARQGLARELINEDMAQEIAVAIRNNDCDGGLGI